LLVLHNHFQNIHVFSPAFGKNQNISKLMQN